MTRWRVWHSRTLTLFAVLIAAALVAYVGVALVAALRNSHNAIQAAKAATAGREASVARFEQRINSLDAQISRLTRQGRYADRQRARLQAEVRALSSQLTMLGVTPVFTSPAAPDRAVRPRAAPTVTRTAQPRQPSDSPTRKPSPSPSCLLNLPTCPLTPTILTAPTLPG